MLKLFNFLTPQYFLIILIPLILYSSLLFIISILISNFVFYLIQHQHVQLSLKGKAPLKAVVILVLSFQILSISVSILSLSGLNTLDKQIKLLTLGKKEWSNYKNYYGLSEIGDFDSFDTKNLSLFFNELYSNNSLYVTNNFDLQKELSKELKNDKEIGGDSPSKYGGENVITVNPKFILQSKITISENTKSFLNKMYQGNSNNYLILVPKSQKQNYELLKKSWTTSIENIIKASGYEGNIQKNVALYNGKNG